MDMRHLVKNEMYKTVVSNFMVRRALLKLHFYEKLEDRFYYAIYASYSSTQATPEWKHSAAFN